MSIFSKLLVLLAFVAISTPVMASEKAPTKGTKSYQAAHATVKETASDMQVRAENTKDEHVQDIAPAAGGMEEPKQAGKSFREEMRLPRKN